MEVITFTTIIYIIATILSTILFFKVWGMCNNVAKILELKERDSEFTKVELTYLHRTNDPTFAPKLQRAIYYDLLEQSQKEDDADNWYMLSYQEWRDVCTKNNWEFPSVFANTDSLEKFVEAFTPKYR